MPAQQLFSHVTMVFLKSWTKLMAHMGGKKCLQSTNGKTTLKCMLGSDVKHRTWTQQHVLDVAVQ